MTLMQQWRYLNLTRNSFCILFPCEKYHELWAKSFLAVSTFVLKELVHSVVEQF